MRGRVHRRWRRGAAAVLVICALISGCDGGRTRGSSPAPGDPAPVVMIVGDSFTVGSGPVPSWRSYAAQAARLLRWQPVIAGASGTGFVSRGRVGRTFQESFEAQLSWRPAPDVLVISGGHNDRRWSPARVRQAAARLVRSVRARWPRTRLVLIGPIWMRTPPRGTYAIKNALAEVADRAGAIFLNPLAEHWLTTASHDLRLPDGVHPTLAGHARLARWLATELRTELNLG